MVPLTLTRTQNLRGPAAAIPCLASDQRAVSQLAGSAMARGHAVVCHCQPAVTPRRCNASRARAEACVRGGWGDWGDFRSRTCRGGCASCNGSSSCACTSGDTCQASGHGQYAACVCVRWAGRVCGGWWLGAGCWYRRLINRRRANRVRRHGRHGRRRGQRPRGRVASVATVRAHSSSGLVSSKRSDADRRLRSAQLLLPLSNRPFKSARKNAEEQASWWRRRR